MLNAAVEEVSEEGIAEHSDLPSESGASASSRATASGVAALGAYGEEDDAATQLVEPPHSEPRWLVQITPFDRRSMEATTLATEMLSGRLPPSTPVWRDGMRDWTPLERVIELPLRSSGTRPVSVGAARAGGEARGQLVAHEAPTSPRAARPTHAMGAAWAAASRSPALAGPAFWLVNAAVALAVAAATLGVLTAGGVFE
jgi:hypothetical protein